MDISRGKNKHKNPYTIQDTYKEYILDKEENSLYYVDYITYMEICTEYLKLKVESIFNSGIFILPFSLGTLSIIKKKPKKLESKHLQIDWLNTNKLGRVVHHLNDHSDRYKMSFRWSKKNTRCKNKGSYSLTMSRDNKRNLSKLIKSGYTNFFEV